MSTNATLKQQSVLVLSLCNAALMDLLLMQLASPLLLWCLSSPLSVCTCVCVASCRGACVCMEGWVRGRLLVVHRSLCQHGGMAGQYGINLTSSIWALLCYHRLCYLSINFAIFVPDLGRWRRLNPLGVQEVSQCLQKGPGHRGGECHWSAQVR